MKFLYRIFYVKIFLLLFLEVAYILWFEQPSLPFVQIGYVSTILQTPATLLFCFCGVLCGGMISLVQGFSVEKTIFFMIFTTLISSWYAYILQKNFIVYATAVLFLTFFYMWLQAGFNWTNWHIFGTLLVIPLQVFYSVRYER